MRGGFRVPGGCAGRYSEFTMAMSVKKAMKAVRKFKVEDFLNSRWMEMAKAEGAEKKVHKEFHQWVEGAKDTQLVKRARQVWDHFNSGNVSTAEKVILVAALLYLISPVDLIPDTIPVVGLLDDLGVAGMVLDYVLQRIDSGADKKKGGKKGKAKPAFKAGPILKAVRKAFK